jgi:hypothetical protein
MTGDDEAIAMNGDEAASLHRLVERLGRLDVEPPKDWAEKERRGEWATIAGLVGGVAGLLWLGWPLSAQQVVIGGLVVLLGACGLLRIRNQNKQG